MNDDKCPICGTEFRFHSSHAAPGSDCPVLDLGDGAIDAFNARFEMLCRPARAGEEPSIYNIDRTPWFNNKDFWTAWNTVMMLRRQLAEAQAAIAALLLLLKEVHNEPVCLPGTRPGQGILDELATEKAHNERTRAIVAKLPKTADGVPVVPGVDTVWPMFADDNVGRYLWRLKGDEWEVAAIGSQVWTLLRFCYSTREAAKVALSVFDAKGRT